MVSTEIELTRHLDKLDTVVAEHLKGYSEKEIASKLGISKAQVVGYVKEWQVLAAQNDTIKARAGTALRNADQHYNSLMKSAHQALDDAELSGNINQRLAAVKTIAELEKMRIGMLQQAGLLEDSDIANEMMETERRQKVLMDILKETVGPCDRCRPLVQEKLRQVTHEVVIING